MLSEIQVVLQILRERRADALATLDGLNVEGLNWHPLPDETNSLYALAVHLLGAERWWIHAQVGGRAIERDRAAEFSAHGDDGAALRARYDETARASEAILQPLTEADLDAPCRAAPNARTMRWAILHILEHYNEHLGQMRLTRQLWENRHARPHEI